MKLFRTYFSTTLSIALLVFLTGCATTSFYVPENTELTISIRHSSDIANFELKGMSTRPSTVDADLMASTDAQGQWVEANHGVLRSAQWGPDVSSGDRFLTAIWHVTLAPPPGAGPTELSLTYDKGHWGDLDISISGPGDDGKPLRITRHYKKGPEEHAGTITFKTTDVMKEQK